MSRSQEKDLIFISSVDSLSLSIGPPLLGRSQVARQRVLIPSFAGSIPAAPIQNPVASRCVCPAWVGTSQCKF